MMVSGAYIATDAQKSPSATSLGRDFVKQVFGYEWRTDHGSAVGEAVEVRSRFSDDFSGGTFHFGLNGEGGAYAVPSPDALYPTSPITGATIMRYADNQSPAAVASVGDTHRSVSMGFPFESISNGESRNRLMSQILKFLTRK